MVEFDMNKVDWGSLQNPGNMFTHFKPTDDKLLKLSQHLYEDYLNLSDENRDYRLIHAMNQMYFAGPNLNLFYEIGDFGGLLGFADIIPTFKGTVLFKIWDKKIWNSRFLRQSRKLIDSVMSEFKLRRLSSETPDVRIVKMAGKAGFKLECAQKNAFLWDGKLMKNFVLGITR